MLHVNFLNDQPLVAYACDRFEGMKIDHFDTPGEDPEANANGSARIMSSVIIGLASLESLGGGEGEGGHTKKDRGCLKGKYQIVVVSSNLLIIYQPS